MKSGQIKIRAKSQSNYFVSFKSLRYSLHSLQIAFPLYFGLPSVIVNVPGFILQMQQTVIKISLN